MLKQSMPQSTGRLGTAAQTRAYGACLTQGPGASGRTLQQPPPPVGAPQAAQELTKTATIRNSVNLKKNTLRLVPLAGDPKELLITFAFDNSAPCTYACQLLDAVLLPQVEALHRLKCLHTRCCCHSLMAFGCTAGCRPSPARQKSPRQAAVSSAASRQPPAFSMTKG